MDLLMKQLELWEESMTERPKGFGVSYSEAALGPDTGGAVPRE